MEKCCKTSFVYMYVHIRVCVRPKHPFVTKRSQCADFVLLQVATQLVLVDLVEGWTF